jgi:lipopolysaccharide export LptBFGC system permease protein LptF
MRHLPQQQTGITFIGIVLMLGVLACFVIFGLRLFPIYNEYLGIKTSMASVVNQPPSSRQTLNDIRKLFLKNTGINSVYYFNDSTIKDHLFIKKTKDGKKYLHVQYENSNKLFQNVYLTVKTDEMMELTGGK